MDRHNKKTQKIYYEKNREKILERQKEYQRKHRDYVRNYYKRWYEENKYRIGRKKYPTRKYGRNTEGICLTELKPEINGVSFN